MTSTSSTAFVSLSDRALNCIKADKHTYRIDPKAKQTVIFEFITGNREVKVTLNLHFCKGSKRFHCTVSRDANRQKKDLDTMSSPVEIKYKKSVSKFYAFLNFPEDCSVNITPKIEVYAEVIAHTPVIEEEPSMFRRAENDPTSKYYHSNLINELEKMEIVPPSWDCSTISVTKHYQNPKILLSNKRAVSSYREDRSLRIAMQKNNVNSRIASARIRRNQALQSRREQIEGQALKREMNQLMLKEKKRYQHEMEIQATWIQFLVGIDNQKYFGVILKMRAMFDKRVKDIDYYQDVAKVLPTDTDYIRHIQIFRM